MKEIFIIEKMVIVGIWELMSDTYYTDESTALDVCLNAMNTMQKIDKNFVARVTKLKLS